MGLSTPNCPLTPPQPRVGLGNWCVLGEGGSIGCLPLFPVTDFTGDVITFKILLLYMSVLIFGVLGPLKIVNKLL